MKQELTQEQKEKIVAEINQPEVLPEDKGNVEVITAKEAGLFEESTGRGDIRGQIARFSAVNVSSRARADQLMSLGKISARNLKKAILAAVALPDPDAEIRFGGTPEQQRLATELFYSLQTAATTRGIALERSIKLELDEKQKAAKEQEEAQ